MQSMSEFFTKVGNRLKSIYVLGEAGSGKSTFCRSLINSWCVAHSEEPIIEDEFDSIKEMKKFEFLFYIDLRRKKDVVRIQEMFSKQYEIKFLNELLKPESRNILILLDGLDEWSCKTVTTNQFQTEGLPERDSSVDYTVITTSRPWKIETLGINDQEIDLIVNLKGFDVSSVETMIDKTVPILKKTFETFGEDKSPSDCKDALNNETLASLTEIPIMLLQLICLWFDDKLQVSSRCAVFSAMLELFFSWNDKKKNKEVDERLFKEMEKKSKDLSYVELPQYLIRHRLCKLHKYLINELSRLAYMTLLGSKKDASLTFDRSALEEFEISDEVKERCLKLGILSEDSCPSLHASTSDSSLLSFVHKTVQEYLAAKYIAFEIKTNIGLSANHELPGFDRHCSPIIKKVFSTCTTLEDILEQANVFILLCGLEPRISSSVSMYIYELVTADKRVLDYRQTITDGERRRHVPLMLRIQDFILDCIQEAQADQANLVSKMYLADIDVFSETCDLIEATIEKQYISPVYVRSFTLYSCIDETILKKSLRYLLKCQNLESIYITTVEVEIDDEDIMSFLEVLKHNSSTLKSLHVKFTTDCDSNYCSPMDYNPMYNSVLQSLRDMSHLVALSIQCYTLSYDDCILLCCYLSGNRHLETISIMDTCRDSSLPLKYCMKETNFICMSRNKHEVDLSKHEKLQHLEYRYPVNVTHVTTSNLNMFTYLSLHNSNYVKVFNNLRTANNLTQLLLCYERGHSNRCSSYDSVTEEMTSMLPLLHQLCKLTLKYFTLTDNIIKDPNKMTNMKTIDLIEVKMSLTTWRQFVDSLSEMPLPVEVKEHELCIASDEEKIYCDENWLENDAGLKKKRKDKMTAWQYVTEQEALFNVTECSLGLEFSTKKKHSPV